MSSLRKRKGKQYAPEAEGKKRGRHQEPENKKRGRHQEPESKKRGRHPASEPENKNQENLRIPELDNTNLRGYPIEEAENKQRAGRRYQGYDMGKVAKKHNKKRKGWFWKVLLISLILSIIIIVAACGVLLYKNRQKTDYLADVNQSNTLDALLEGQSNIQVTSTYTRTNDGNDYTAVRLIKTQEDGNYYSYYKTEGLEKDYKEVMADEEVYRNDGNYTYYYGIIGSEYSNLMSEMEKEFFQLSDDEKIDSQTENGDRILIQSSYEVQAGDKYTEVFNFSAGDVIVRNITMDADTKRVVSETESFNEEEFYTYNVEFDVEDKTPNFYSKARKKKKSRKCMVYFDYGKDDEKIYTFDVPCDIYFTLFDHEEYTVYMDPDKEREFTEFEMQSQNPESLLTLYMVKAEN